MNPVEHSASGQLAGGEGTGFGTFVCHDGETENEPPPLSNDSAEPEVLSFKRKQLVRPRLHSLLLRSSGVYSAPKDRADRTRSRRHVLKRVKIPLHRIPTGEVRPLRIWVKREGRSHIPEQFLTPSTSAYRKHIRRRKYTASRRHVLDYFDVDPQDFRLYLPQKRRKIPELPKAPEIPSTPTPVVNQEPLKPACDSKSTFLNRLCQKITQAAWRVFNLLKSLYARLVSVKDSHLVEKHGDVRKRGPYYKP